MRPVNGRETKTVLTASNRKVRLVALSTLAVLALAVGVHDLRSKSSWNPLVPVAEAQASNVVLTAGAVYGLLRLINAMLSTLQEVEVGAGFVIDGSAQPMKFLEPVDDTVERVSDVIFAIGAATALVMVGLGPIAALGAVSLGLGIFGRMAALATLVPPWVTAASRLLLRWGLVTAIVLPLVFSVGIRFAEWLTQPSYCEQKAVLAWFGGDDDRGPTDESSAGWLCTLSGISCPDDETPSRVDAFLYQPLSCSPVDTGLTGGNPDGPEAPESGGWVSDVVDELCGLLNISCSSSGEIYSRAGELFEAALVLIGIFLLRMLVFPAMLLWMALALLKRSAGGAA